MLQTCHRLHVLLVCSTLWYCACVQLAPLPCLRLNTFPSHSLPGKGKGQLQRLLLAGSQEPGRGLQQLPSWSPLHVVLPLGVMAAQLHNLPLLQRRLPRHLLHDQNCTNTF